MKRLLPLAALLVLALPLVTVAAPPPAGYLTAEHPAPTEFRADGTGGFVGVLDTGASFTQRPVVTDTSVRLHRFEVGDWHFYVSDRGAFTATTDLAAVSRYLAFG